MKVKIDDIIIKDRIRQDPGDIYRLRESIEQYGLINPITITENMELIAGHRRLEAVKSLGWDEVECNIIKAASDMDRLLMEAEENLNRKDFTPDEIIRIKEAKEYLSSTGFERFLKRMNEIFSSFFGWFRRLFSRNRAQY